MNGKYVRRSTGVRVLTLVLAFVLVMGASVAGTLAWLTAKTTQVTNTFTSAELFDDPGTDFTLWEHKAYDTDGDGRFEWAKKTGESYVKVDKAEEADEVSTNTYSILPGVNIPKDPTVDVVDLKEHAYLYIKVTGLPLDTGLTASVDTANWTALGTDYPGVYVYSGTAATDKVIKATNTDKKTFTATILTSNQIEVAGTYAGTNDNITLSFEAYMVQATGNGSNAAEAWANTYGASGSNG